MPGRRSRLGALASHQICAIAVVTALMWTLASCSESARAPHAGSVHHPAPAAWMMTRYALTQVSADPTVRAGLRGAEVYQLIQPGQAPIAWPGSIPVVTFTAAGQLEQAVHGHQLPAGTRAVLYDPEAWHFTPADEQRDPVPAAQRAMAAARAHGLTLIVAPALNLTTVHRYGTGPRWQQFLHSGLIAGLARTTDVIELQAQSLERDVPVYESFVRQAVAQARAANPQVKILAGLSTNPPGPPVSSQQLTAAINATQGLVSGYWLNIPGKGPRCPTCNTPRPDVGRAALRAVL